MKPTTYDLNRKPALILALIDCTDGTKLAAVERLLAPSVPAAAAPAHHRPEHVGERCGTLLGHVAGQ